MPNIVESQYSPFGQIISGPPDRPDDPSKRFDPKKDEIEYSALLQDLGWTPDEFEATAKFGRPAPLGKRLDPTNHWNLRTMYSRRAFELWRADVLALARKLR